MDPDLKQSNLIGIRKAIQIRMGSFNKSIPAQDPYFKEIRLKRYSDN